MTTRTLGVTVGRYQAFTEIEFWMAESMKALERQAESNLLPPASREQAKTRLNHYQELIEVIQRRAAEERQKLQEF